MTADPRDAVVEAARKWHGSRSPTTPLEEYQRIATGLSDAIRALDAAPAASEKKERAVADGFDDEGRCEWAGSAAEFKEHRCPGVERPLSDAQERRVREIVAKFIPLAGEADAEMLDAIRSRLDDLESKPALDEERVKTLADVAGFMEQLERIRIRLSRLESPPAPAAPTPEGTYIPPRMESFSRPMTKVEIEAARRPKAEETVTDEDRWERFWKAGGSSCVSHDYARAAFLREAAEIRKAARRKALEEALSAEPNDPIGPGWEYSVDKFNAGVVAKENAIRSLLSQPPAAQGGGA